MLQEHTMAALLMVVVCGFPWSSGMAVQLKESCITDCSEYHNYNPYCGTDGVTYPNICQMYNAICRNRGTLTVKERGRCGKKKVIIQESCLTDCSPYIGKPDPQCGTNNVTYPNRCELYNEVCRTGGDLQLKHQGKCGEKEKEIPIPEETCMSNCTPYLEIKDPFCGNDGTTYPNRCELHNAICKSGGNLKMVHQGKCVVQRHEWQGTDSKQAMSVEISADSSPLLELGTIANNEIHSDSYILNNAARSNEILPGDNGIINEWNNINPAYFGQSDKTENMIAEARLQSLDITSNTLILQYPSKKKLPLREIDALLEGWKLLQDDCADSSSPFVGRRLIFLNDHTFIAIYDMRGVLSGVQFSYKHSRRNEDVGVDKPRLLYKGRVYITTYFTNVVDICKEDSPYRSKVVVKIVLLTGMGKHVVVPWVRTLMRFEDAQAWSRGKCFPGLGQHYWHELDADSRCRQLFPISLLYTKDGLLNGFGFNTLRHVESSFVQQTRRSDLGMYMDPVPKCLLRHPNKHLSTMFVVLDTRKEDIACEW